MPPYSLPTPPSGPILPPQPPQNVMPTDGRVQRGHSESFKNILYMILLFFFAPFFAVIMILFVFQSYVVDGSSMMPNLQNGNRVFILKLPKTLASIKDKSYIPSRHEVIVFKKPNDPDIQLIKRVVGLPGDRVVVKNNHITIYNNDYPEGFDPDANTQYGKYLEPTLGEVDTTVGANELFVCGDNRSPGGSLDSRTGLGLVPTQNIIGRLWVRYFPLSGFKLFSYLRSDLQSWSAHLLNYS